MREQALLPARQEHDVELQALGGVQRHQRHAIVAVLAPSASMTSETCSRKPCSVSNSCMKRIELFQVLQPRLRLRALVVLPHLRVAGLVQDQLGQLGVLHAVDLARASARRRRSRSASALRALPVELLGLDDLARGLIERDARARAPAR